MKKYLFVMGLGSIFTYAQVGVNTTEPKATFHINVEDPNNPDSSAGILIPRVSQNPSTGNEIGQLIFNTSTSAFYFWNGTSWTPISESETSQGNAMFTETKNSNAITMENSSKEQSIPGTVINFTLTEEKKVQFTATVNFKGRSSAFAPLLKLKLTNKDTNNSEIIDKVSNTFLSDGISDYYGNLQLISLKNLPTGNYKIEVIADYNNCCNFNFIYEVGGAETPVSLLVQYK